MALGAISPDPAGVPESATAVADDADDAEAKFQRQSYRFRRLAESGHPSRRSVNADIAVLPLCVQDVWPGRACKTDLRRDTRFRHCVPRRNSFYWRFVRVAEMIVMDKPADRRPLRGGP
jgi:hypothetical protein